MISCWLHILQKITKRIYYPPAHRLCQYVAECWVISPFCDFAVLDVSLAVNWCLNCSFLHVYLQFYYISQLLGLQQNCLALPSKIASCATVAEINRGSQIFSDALIAQPPSNFDPKHCFWQATPSKWCKDVHVWRRQQCVSNEKAKVDSSKFFGNTSLGDFTSNELSRVKIHQAIWPVRESQKIRYK